MKHGSLFSGIGGFELAAQWIGWENVFHCEINPFGKAILKHYWPNSKSYDDITKTDFTIWRGKLDILTGGFPCQPYSTAGKRLGKEDDRHLWPEMLRAIREIKPTWIVGENVYGLVNWNGGLVFEEVQADLEAEGYEVQPVLLPAASVNAPHKRERVWFIAYSNNKGRSCGFVQFQETNGKIPKRHNDAKPCYTSNKVAENTLCSGRLQREPKQERAEIREQRNISSRSSERIYLSEGYATNTKFKGLEGFNRQRQGCTEHRNNEGLFFRSKNKFNATNTTSERLQRSARKGKRWKDFRFTGNSKQSQWENFPTQSPICGRDDGLPSKLDGITFSKWRQESIKGYGNAIVPQVAYNIFKAVESFNFE